MRRIYMNRDTGELMPYENMISEWRNEYDGDDPTNILSRDDMYVELGEYQCPNCKAIRWRGIEFMKERKNVAECIMCRKEVTMEEYENH